MAQDRFSLDIATASDVSARAYDEGLWLLLTGFPGADARLDRAIAADASCAAARIAKARSRQILGDMAGARAELARVDEHDQDLSPRDASQRGIFALLFSGQGAGAEMGVRAHLDEWPRDALVMSTIANQLGLIGMSGRAGREQELADFLHSQQRHWEDDPWFGAHYAMALSEVGEQARARPVIERSLAEVPRNAYAAHAMGHVCYETGAHAESSAFLRAWLRDYPRHGMLRGHLSWHLALNALQSGDVDEGLRLYTEAFVAEDYPAAAMLKVIDGAAFLWRAELAGHPGDPGRWHALRLFAEKMFPKPGMPMTDWHVALTQAAGGDGDALETRIRETDTLIAEGRLSSGHAMSAVLRGLAAFQRRDFDGAIAAIAPMLPERERIGGSRAQVDLVEATLLKAYLESGRLDEMRALLHARRPGPAALPVAGIDTLH